MKNNLLKGLVIFIFSFFTLYGIGANAAKVEVIPAPTNSDKHCIVGIAQGEKGTYEETVRQAISAAGGLNSIIKEGDTVLIKPNIVAASPSGAGRITDYRVVQVVIDMALEAGAGKVIVAESPISIFARGSFELSIAVAGYDKIERAEVRELDAYDCAYQLQLVFGQEVLKDIDGFIEFSLRIIGGERQVSDSDIQYTLAHDLGGALRYDELMMPRVSDYGQYSINKIFKGIK